MTDGGISGALRAKAMGDKTSPKPIDIGKMAQKKASIAAARRLGKRMARKKG